MVQTLLVIDAEDVKRNHDSNDITALDLTLCTALNSAVNWITIISSAATYAYILGWSDQSWLAISYKLWPRTYNQNSQNYAFSSTEISNPQL